MTAVDDTSIKDFLITCIYAELFLSFLWNTSFSIKKSFYSLALCFFISRILEGKFMRVQINQKYINVVSFFRNNNVYLIPCYLKHLLVKKCFWSLSITKKKKIQHSDRTIAVYMWRKPGQNYLFTYFQLCIKKTKRRERKELEK